VLNGARVGTGACSLCLLECMGRQCFISISLSCPTGAGGWPPISQPLGPGRVTPRFAVGAAISCFKIACFIAHDPQSRDPQHRGPSGLGCDLVSSLAAAGATRGSVGECFADPPQAAERTGHPSSPSTVPPRGRSGTSMTDVTFSIIFVATVVALLVALAVFLRRKGVLR
jgi:hypothetical protein